MALLNAAASRFVGRTAQLAQLERLLSDARLVSLCGPPGIGKTRTALEFLSRHCPEALICDLAVISDPATLSGSLAAQLGLTVGDVAFEALTAATADDDTLLLLDNAELLVEPLSELLQRWLAACPQMRVVVTTRERLRISGERVLELPPLRLASDDNGPAEAATLFIDRLRDTVPELQLDASERGLVESIVAQLDGIPLAIELAAARAPALGLQRLDQRLHEQLQLLSRGMRGVPDRQATLRGAIDWSWRMLSSEQQRTLAYCSVFRGPFDVDAAEAVVGMDALDLLQDLRDRSLLLSPKPGRFDMYASIAAYAVETLAQREDAPLPRRAHARHYIALAERHARAFEREGASLEPLLELHENLLSATQHSAASQHSELAARGCLALGPTLRTRGPLKMHVELLDAALAIVDDDPELLRARALARRGLGQLEDAEADLLAALDSCDDDWLYATARKDLGVLYHQRRDIDRARVCYESALSHARKLADRRVEGVVIGNMGALDHDIGRFEQAAKSYNEALALLRAAGDRRLEAIFITNLGVLEQEQGCRESASRCYRRALELLEQSPDMRFEGIALGNLGVMEHEAGNVQAARKLHERALQRLRQVGERSSKALCLARLGAALADLGQPAAADERLRAAEQLAGQASLMLRVVQLHRCFVDLAEGNEPLAMKRVALAQKSSEGARKLVDVSDDARVVLRMLGSRLAANDAPRLEVASDASWFCAPGGSRHSLQKFASARRILDCLAQARLDTPGTPIEANALFVAGWPDVQISRRSAMNRLFVALAKLRKSGLKLLLLRRGEGYLLDPNTPLLRISASTLPDDD